MQGVYVYIGTFGGRKMAGGNSGGYTFGFNVPKFFKEVMVFWGCVSPILHDSYHIKSNRIKSNHLVVAVSNPNRIFAYQNVLK